MIVLLLLAGVFGTALLVSLLDPDFTLKVGVTYLIASFGTLMLVRTFPTDNQLPHSLGDLLLWMGLMLFGWWVAWRQPIVRVHLPKLRAFQLQAWTKISNWI